MWIDCCERRQIDVLYFTKFFSPQLLYFWLRLQVSSFHQPLPQTQFIILCTLIRFLYPLVLLLTTANIFVQSKKKKNQTFLLTKTEFPLKFCQKQCFFYVLYTRILNKNFLFNENVLHIFFYYFLNLKTLTHSGDRRLQYCLVFDYKNCKTYLNFKAFN